MATLSSQHHSFDIALASEFGIECAILIHHFQHWIRINRSTNRNIIEGRCWTFEKMEVIKAHFPYLNYEEVKYIIEKLVAFGVLIKGKFNKNPMNQTNWYAFVDEKRFQVDQEFCDKIKEMFTKRENSLIDQGKFPNASGKIPGCNIGSHTKHTHTKETKREIKESNLKVAKEKSAAPPPPPPDSFYRSSFEGKVIISEEARKRLIDKFGLESLVDRYAEILYRRIKTNPKKYGKLQCHDLVIEDWIEKDLEKSQVVTDSPPKEKLPPNSQGLNDIQLENWKKNYYLVETLKKDEPGTFGGMEFYFKEHILKDKNYFNFSIKATIDHRSFCILLDKQYKSCIEEVIFGSNKGDW